MSLLRHIAADELRRLTHGTMAEAIGIELTEVGDDFVKGRMPVDARTTQPFGILHGGASAALAETLGSIAGTLSVNPEISSCVGLEINANHIRSVKSGVVNGVATPVHIGSTTQVWEIRITDEKERLVCISRLTLAVLSRPQKLTRDS